MVRGATSAKKSTWRLVLETYSALMRLFAEEMWRDFDLTLDQYDVLAHLAEAPDQRLRMSELADSLVLSRSWLTRRIDRMEEAGLVRRIPAGDDARSTFTTLTPKGRRLFEHAVAAHRKSVKRNFLDQLFPEEDESIRAAFERISGRLT